MKELLANHSSTIDRIQYQVDLQEDYSRLNNVRIEGITEKKDESIEQIHHKVSKIFSEKMQLNDLIIDIEYQINSQALYSPSQDP